ncbi:hypothetical protein L2E82_50505 [Cichorium intybus]|nr:hypothetical protein L2E82_50505 [Cichorium intybus]
MKIPRFPINTPLFSQSPSLYLLLFHCLKMSIATSALAEAYVMRKHHQEKMKKTTTSDAQGTTKQSILDNDHHSSSTIGCFPVLFKKVHPSTTAVTHSSSRPSR